MTTVSDAKTMATRLRQGLERAGTAVTHSQALELVAQQLGHRDWNTASAALNDATAAIGDATAAVSAPAASHQRVIPIVRTFPGDQAHDFYLGYLGFTVDWDHRFRPDLPLYQQISWDGCVLHLSEHHGDATPGSAVRLEIADVRGLHRRLHASGYPLRPGLEEEDWGLDMTVQDPFGNRLIFHQPVARDTAR